MKKYIVYSGIIALLFSGCAVPSKIKGVNYLQTSRVSMDSSQSRASLLHLKGIGANTVAFVPFLEQDAPDSTDVRLSDKVTDKQLRAGIRNAKALGFQVVLKPQILIPGSWPGNIEMADDSGWKQWFDNYTKAIEHYADIARNERVNIFVIGTELNHTADLKFWQTLIASIRSRFKGKLTYAAHNAVEVDRFKYWELLDSIAITLYPSLGDKPERDAMLPHILKVVDELRAIGMQHKKPLWIAEVGIPSRYGAQLEPWEWQGAHVDAAQPDEDIQAMALSLWLDALNGEWNQGVMLWCWNSDPSAGGSQDKGFTVQNKRAEQVITCCWRGRCGDLNAKE